MKITERQNLVTAFVVAVMLFAGIFLGVFGLFDPGVQVDTPGSEANDNLSGKNEEGRDDAGGQADAESDAAEPALETYAPQLFLSARWGSGPGEVGLSNPSEQGVEDAGPNYGPQSFDVAQDGRLFLLDSVNGRVIQYGADGKYVKDFPIACGGTGDIRMAPDQNKLYVLSWRCSAVYQYEVAGELVDTYNLSPEMQSATLGAGGLDFDEKGNLMIELTIKSYSQEERFYQVGKNGDEWKKNNYTGFLLGNGDYYSDKWVDWQTGQVQISDQNGAVKKEFTIKNSAGGSKMYMYFSGSDKENNIYVRIGLEFDDSANNGRTENFFWKYDLSGNKRAAVDVLGPLSLEQRDDYFYTSYFNSRRIGESGDIYYAFFFKGEGLKIYKYSKVN